jgi:hypothetical protein
VSWNYWSLLAVAQHFCMYENYKVFVFMCDSGYLRKVEWICLDFSPRFCKYHFRLDIIQLGILQRRWCLVRMLQSCAVSSTVSASPYVTGECVLHNDYSFADSPVWRLQVCRSN